MFILLDTFPEVDTLIVAPSSLSESILLITVDTLSSGGLDTGEIDGWGHVYCLQFASRCEVWSLALTTWLHLVQVISKPSRRLTSILGGARTDSEVKGLLQQGQLRLGANSLEQAAHTTLSQAN